VVIKKEKSLIKTTIIFVAGSFAHFALRPSMSLISEIATRINSGFVHSAKGFASVHDVSVKTL